MFAAMLPGLKARKASFQSEGVFAENAVSARKSRSVVPAEASLSSTSPQVASARIPDSGLSQVSIKNERKAEAH